LHFKGASSKFSHDTYSSGEERYYGSSGKGFIPVGLRENRTPSLPSGKITIMFVKIDNNSIIKSDIAIVVKL